MRRYLPSPVRRAGRAAIAALKALGRARARVRLRRTLKAPPAPADEGYILILTPEAGVDPHLAAQCVVGRTLRELGHSVLFVRCFQHFRRCPVMDMYALPYGRSAAELERTCLDCAHLSFHHLDGYGLDALDLRTIVTPQMTADIRAAVAAAPADLREFTFDGVAFGKLCAMDLVLANKLADLSAVAPQYRAAWLEYIEASVTAYRLVERIAEAYPVSRLVHFNDYSLMLGGRLAAQKLGIPVTGVTLASHRGVDRRKYVLAHDPLSLEFVRLGDAWQAFRDLPLPADRIREIADDILARLQAGSAHTYSPPKTFGASDLHERLGLDPGKKLLVAFTSSLDEMMATGVTRAGLGFTPPARKQPFADQIAWLQWLIDHVEASDDRQLVVRVHPREGANKRDKVASQHLTRLRDHFDRPFRNCRFVWPGDTVSSYDLGELADLALVSWSTIGLEMARLGLPVLASTNGLSPFPHDDFMEWGATPEAYAGKLEEMLSRRPTLAMVSRAFRWYNLFHLGLSLDLGDIVPSPDWNGLPPYRVPAEARAIEDVVIGRKSLLDINLGRLQRLRSPAAEAAETQALRDHLGGVVRYLITGSDPGHGGNARIAVRPAGSGGSGPDGVAIDGPWVELAQCGKTWKRYSPLCARLARLCAGPEHV